MAAAVAAAVAAVAALGVKGDKQRPLVMKLFAALERRTRSQLSPTARDGSARNSFLPFPTLLFCVNCRGAARGLKCKKGLDPTAL